jgi:ABC-type uncharacterized transport system permease subunit
MDTDLGMEVEMLEFFGPVTPVILIGAIMGLVEFLKQFGVQGKWSALAALVLGLVFGVLYQVPALNVYFEIAVNGLLLGLSCAGYYAVGMKVARRAGGLLN